MSTLLAGAHAVDPDTVPVARQRLRLSTKDAAELRMRLVALLNEYTDRPPDPQDRPYSLFVALLEDAARD